LDLWGITWIVKSIAKDEAVVVLKLTDVLWSDVIESFFLGV